MFYHTVTQLVIKLIKSYQLRHYSPQHPKEIKQGHTKLKNVQNAEINK